MTNFLTVLFAIIPIILLMGCGFVLRRLDLMTAAGASEIGKIVYWLTLPCLLFYKLATADASLDLPWLGIAIGSFCCCLSVALVLLFSRNAPAPAVGAYATISFRANAAFVGLPVAMLLIQNQVADDSLVDYFLILLASLVLLFNVLSVIGFLLPHHGVDAQAIKKVFIGILKNPLVWSCALGFLCSKLGWGQAIKDNVIMISMDLLGQSAIPMALLMAGATIQLRAFKQLPLAFWFWNIWKMLCLPSIILVLCIVFQCSQEISIALCIMGACPGAVASVPMAQELGGDETMSAQSVIVTTLICPFSLVAFVLLAQAYTHA